MGKLRVHQLAKELGMSSKDFIQKAQELGFDYIKSHANTLDDSDIRELRNKLGTGAQEAQKPKRRTVLRRRAVRSTGEETGTAGEVRVITSRLSEGEEKVIETKKIEIPSLPTFGLDDFTPPVPTPPEPPVVEEPVLETVELEEDTTTTVTEPETPPSVEEPEDLPLEEAETVEETTETPVEVAESTPVVEDTAPVAEEPQEEVAPPVEISEEVSTEPEQQETDLSTHTSEPEKLSEPALDEPSQETTSMAPISPPEPDAASTSTSTAVASTTQVGETDVQTTTTTTQTSKAGASRTVANVDQKTSSKSGSDTPPKQTPVNGGGNRQIASIVRRIELPNRRPRHNSSNNNNNNNRSQGGGRRYDGPPRNNTNTGGGGGGPMPFQPPPPGGNNDNRKPDNRKGPRNKKSRRVQKMQRYDEQDFGGKKNRRRKKNRKEQKTSNAPTTIPMSDKKRVVRVDEAITIADLAHQMSLKATEIIRFLLGKGMMATINQAISVEEATDVAKNFGYEVQSVGFEEEEILKRETYESDPEDIVTRAPIVTVMGHVDHGKTSLLDAIREARVADSEAGGITQHIGAYLVETESQGQIVFLDTPGHAAFTAMRARGAQCTDIVILVVAADDGIMPQTIEAINHSKAAGVPIVVAINKIDKAGANPDQVKYSLMSYGLVSEEFGGDSMMLPVSAHTKEGISELLESVLLQAELLELQANPTRPAQGVVVESRIEKGRGPVATLLVQEGTLRSGDSVVTGPYHGRIRAMFDDHNKPITEAGPAVPVKVLGLSGLPTPGELFDVVADEKAARQVAAHRQDQLRRKEQGSARRPSFADIWGENEKKEVNFILKADVQGTLEALRESLNKIEHEEVLLNITHAAVGGISESDVNLAATTDGIIIGFNVRADSKAQRLAENEGVEIRIYRVIYDLLDDVKAAMSEHITPTLQEKPIGSAEIRKIFTVPRAGKVAGSYVLDGKITRGCLLRLYREDIEIYAGKVQTLKRFKDDVREVARGFECGIQIEGYQDIREGDVIEAYELEEIKVTLE